MRAIYCIYYCVQTYAGISVVKYCHTCYLLSHGTDLLGPFLWYCPYKNEITRLIHSIMVLSFFGPFMWEFASKNELTFVFLIRGFCAQDDARRCKMMQDNARRCKIMQDNARCCKMV